MQRTDHPMRHPARDPAASTCFATAWVSALVLVAGQVRAQGTTIVSPSDRATLEGSASSSYPLGRHDSRFQQLFHDLGPARLLRGHAYRRDALSSRGTVAAFQTSMEVRMSNPAIAPENASRDFANNLGPAPVVVLPRGFVSFPQTLKPSLTPASFEFSIPYKVPYAWTGVGSLCVDISIDDNKLTTGNGKNFSPSLDAHELFASGRNLQPGYPFGRGCAAAGNTAPATSRFELQHLGNRMDLDIAVRNGVPTTSGNTAVSALLLSSSARAFAWPTGSNCTLYGDPALVVALSGRNSAIGGWTGKLPLGPPPIAGFEMIGQVLSLSRSSGDLAFSDASRLITPPAGRGVVSSRIVHASDRTSPTGTVSFSVPVTAFR